MLKISCNISALVYFCPWSMMIMCQKSPLSVARLTLAGPQFLNALGDVFDTTISRSAPPVLNRVRSAAIENGHNRGYIQIILCKITFTTYCVADRVWAETVADAPSPVRPVFYTHSCCGRHDDARQIQLI